MKGRIHSFESMGLVDGPGIRSVVFMQGCKLRCAYCHNPDTWDTGGGWEVEAAELMGKIARYLPYFQKSGGGVTFSGGEPLLQPEFLLEMLRLCRKRGVHTAVDTAGIGLGAYEEILALTDLVILDLKHVTAEGYKGLTGIDIRNTRPFFAALKKSQVDLWLRHVVVPGITDSKEHIESLKRYIAQFDNVRKVELLPYHTLGKSKYEKQGLPYRLNEAKPVQEECIRKLEKLLPAV